MFIDIHCYYNKDGCGSFGTCTTVYIHCAHTVTKYGRHRQQQHIKCHVEFIINATKMHKSYKFAIKNVHTYKVSFLHCVKKYKIFHNLIENPIFIVYIREYTVKIKKRSIIQKKNL